MASKTPTINLVDYRSLSKREGGHPRYDADDHFRIESLKNTIDYRAGQFVKEITVKDLINMGWNVNIRATRNSDFE
jgi:hypothetical protein